MAWTSSQSVVLVILVAAIGLVSFRTFALSIEFPHTHSYLKSSTTFTFRQVWGTSFIGSTSYHHDRNQRRSVSLSESIPDIESKSHTPPLCDLQTFLRLCNLVDSGGEAKTVIQDSQCLLNGIIETRRGKKLYAGDKVSYLSAVDLDVATAVEEKGYMYKLKVKKVKPLPKDEEGNEEFGGSYRSEEWREERKMKKAERKIRNQKSR
jgi:ribosome-associated protein YbcJ (S4-like RNA binding protein)